MLQTKVVYESEDEVKRVLGTKGMSVLQAVLTIIQEKAARENWPLERIIVSRYNDPEIRDWMHVLIQLDFSGLDFEAVNSRLEALYPALDDYALLLDKKSKEILNLFIYDLSHS